MKEVDGSADFEQQLPQLQWSMRRFSELPNLGYKPLIDGDCGNKDSVNDIFSIRGTFRAWPWHHTQDSADGRAFCSLRQLMWGVFARLILALGGGREV